MRPRRSAAAAFGRGLRSALGTERGVVRGSEPGVVRGSEPGVVRGAGLGAAFGLALALALSVGAGPGCGYRLAARPPLPGDVERVAVPLVRNDTSEPEVGQVVSEALGRRVQMDDRLGGASAEARLEGRVVSVQAVGAAFPLGVPGPGAWDVSLRVELRLVRRGGGEPLSKVTVAGSEPYFAGAGPEETDANRRRALQRLADRLADEAWARLTGG